MKQRSANPIKRGWRAMWFKDDDDNTPQGKLARGCFYVFYWLIAAVVLFGGIMPAVYQYFGLKP